MENFPDTTSILRALREARQRWVNSSAEDTDAIWDLVEAFETLDALMLNGYEPPADWRAEAP